MRALWPHASALEMPVYVRGTFRVDDQSFLRTDDEIDRIYFGTTGPMTPVRRGGPKKSITNR